MRPDDVRRLLRQQPFEPFRIVLIRILFCWSDRLASPPRNCRFP
jgi:hypothetical protein